MYKCKQRPRFVVIESSVMDAFLSSVFDMQNTLHTAALPPGAAGILGLAVPTWDDISRVYADFDKVRNFISQESGYVYQPPAPGKL